MFFPTIGRRVRRNVRLAPLHLQGRDKEAARRLFSFLGTVEEVAVLAAKRGDGVRGQLRDEIVHERSFKAIAEKLGGFEEPAEEIRVLLDGLGTLEGEESLAILNIVCEFWLETVFKHVGRWGLADGLFEIVAREERRHVHRALEEAKPDPAEVLPILRWVEARLRDLAQSPHFLLPLYHLGGMKRVGEMGREVVRRHRKACAHLGVAPGPWIKEMERASRAAIQYREPGPVHENEWEQSKRSFMEPDQAYPMISALVLDFPYDEREAEFRVARAAANILARNPRLNRTVRHGEVFAPHSVRIGFRRIHDDYGRNVTTVYLENPQYLSVRRGLRRLRNKAKKARTRDYEVVPSTKGLEQFLPPGRAAVTISANGVYGLPYGLAPLIPMEGAPICLTLGEVMDLPRWDAEQEKYVPKRSLIVGVAMSHRPYDGRDGGCFCQQLVEEFESYKQESEGE